MGLIRGKTIGEKKHLVFFVSIYLSIIIISLLFIAPHFIKQTEINEGALLITPVKILFSGDGGKPKNFPGDEAFKFLIRDVVIKDGFHIQLYHRRAYAC